MATLNSVRGFTSSYRNVSLDKLLQLCEEYFRIYSHVSVDLVRLSDCYQVDITGDFLDLRGERSGEGEPS